MLWYERRDNLRIGKLCVLIYSIVALLFTVYIITTPIASIRELDSIEVIWKVNWFDMDQIPYGKLLSAMVVIAAVVLLIAAVRSIINDNNAHITKGYAISTLMYTISAVSINFSISSYASGKNLSISEYGIAWHILLILTMVNSVLLVVVLVIRNSNRKYNQV